MFVQGGGDLVDAFYATMILTLALIGSGLRDLLGPPSPRRGGRRPGRGAAGHRAAPARLAARSRAGHRRRGGRWCCSLAGLGMGSRLRRWSPATRAALGDYVLPMPRPPRRRCWCSRRWPGCSTGWRRAPASLAWLGLLFALVVMLFGEVFRMPQWLQDVSPFEHLALVPAEAFRWAPFLVLGGLAVALSVAASWPSTGETSPGVRHPPSPVRSPDCRIWSPEPGWSRSAGGGPSTVGVWRTVGGRRGRGQAAGAPSEHDPPELSDPRHFAYWRRAADVVTSGVVLQTPGLRAPRAARRGGRGRHHGGTPRVEDEHAQGLSPRARSGGSRVPRSRPARAWREISSEGAAGPGEHRGGWPTLAWTTVADVADHLGHRREAQAARLHPRPEAAARRPGAGEPPGRVADDVVAIDWCTLGWGRWVPTSATSHFNPRGARAPRGRLPSPDCRRGLATREEVPSVRA